MKKTNSFHKKAAAFFSGFLVLGLLLGGGFLIWSEGKEIEISGLDHEESQSYCQNLGMRLPTVLELIQGVPGLEMIESEDRPREGFYRVISEESDFWLSYVNYEKPKDPSQMKSYWSSSISLKDGGQPYHFSAKFGFIGVSKPSLRSPHFVTTCRPSDLEKPLFIEAQQVLARAMERLQPTSASEIRASK